MKEGGDYYFNAIFWGNGNFYSTLEMKVLCMFGNYMCRLIKRIYPFHDEDLARQLRYLHPGASDMELLGPLLTKKVILLEPSFRYLHPLSDKDDADLDLDEFRNLSTPLENLTDEIVHGHGMGERLMPHNGGFY